MAIFLFTLLFCIISFFPYSYNIFRYDCIIVLFLGCSFLYLKKKNGRVPATLDDTQLMLVLFLLLLFSGLVNAQDSARACATYITFVSRIFFVFSIARITFNEERRFIVLSWVITVCGLSVSILGLADLLTGRLFLPASYVLFPRYAGIRPMSTLSNPTDLGSYCLACLPFIYFSIRRARKLRLLGVCALLIVVFVLFMTFSRAAFLGFFGLVFARFYFAHRKRLAFLFLCLAAGIVLLATVNNDRNIGGIDRFGFARMFYGTDAIISDYRVSRIVMATRILRDHPFCGIGLRQFPLRFRDYFVPYSEYSTPSELMIADNMYLTLLAETGIVGFLGFVLFVGFIFWGALKRLKVADKSLSHEFLLLLLPGLVGMLINMGGTDSLYWPSMCMFFALLCGSISACVTHKGVG